MNLTEQVRSHGIHPQTACRWSRDDRLPVPAARVNARTVLIASDAVLAPGGARGNGVYAQISSHDRMGDLGRQAARLAGWAARAGGTVARGEDEAGSGMNDTRLKARVLADPAAVTLVAEHRDRLGRVNTRQAKAALAAHGRRSARNRAQQALRSAARHAGPSTPEAT